MIERELGRVNEEEGMTIIEVLTAVTMLLIVLVTFLTVLHSVNKGLILQQERSGMVDQARLAMQRLDREIRSANLLYNPASETPANYMFRLYTQSNATTRTPPMQCVEWQIDDSNQLIRRSWSPGEPEGVTDWRVMADDLVNRDLSPAVPAFALDPDPAKGGRSVDITLMIDVDPADSSQKTIRIQSSLTGRNTVFGFPLDVCSPGPS